MSEEISFRLAGGRSNQLGLTTELTVYTINFIYLTCSLANYVLIQAN